MICINIIVEASTSSCPSDVRVVSKIIVLLNYLPWLRKFGVDKRTNTVQVVYWTQMPLPAALLARLQKRGIVKEEEKQGFKRMIQFSEFECKMPKHEK